MQPPNFRCPKPQLPNLETSTSVIVFRTPPDQIPSAA